VSGIAQNIHGAANIASAQLGYDMAIEGTDIYTLESKTSGTEGHLWRISNDGGLSWNVQDAALFPQVPNDDLRGVTVRGGTAYVITEEFTDGTEIWSIDVSGSLP